MLKVNIQLCVKVLLDRELLRNIIGAVRSVYAKCQNNFYESLYFSNDYSTILDL